MLEKDNYYNSVLVVKDLLNQLEISYNSIVSLLQDIENSLTFCKLKTLHPSIIKSHEFLEELKRIQNHYGNLLPFEVKYENILKFESLLQVDCKISSSEIVYFLSLPINSVDYFDLYYLHPLPTKNQYKFITVIPQVKYLLKSDKNKIKLLNEICIKNEAYQCPERLISHRQGLCEEEVMLNKTTRSCSYVELTVDHSHIDFIPEISQLLLVFPNKDEITISNHKGSETKSLEGVFLINPEGDNITYNNRIINYVSVSRGQPDILRSLKFMLPTKIATNFTVNLREIRMKDIMQSPIVPAFAIPSPTIYNHNMLWPLLISLIILISAMIFLYVMFRYFFRLPTETITGQQPQPPPRSSTNLPVEIRF